MRGTLFSLIGALPGNLVLVGNSLDALQLPSIRVGLPSALLLGRPDIRMMEARMRAANANIEVARARLLPAIDLSAQVGYSGGTFASLLQPQNLLVNTAAALAVSIFDGGMKQGEEAFAQSYYEEMVETYGKTVLQAVREVEGAMTNLETTRRRLNAQNGVTRAALNRFRSSSDAFSVGALDQAGLLESRRNYQRVKDEAKRVTAELLRGYANLSYALGLGSAVNGPSEDFPSVNHLQGTTSSDLRVGFVDGRLMMLPYLSPLGQLGTAGAWEAELPGVFHRNSLLPLWRDLDARYASDRWVPGDAVKPWIRAVHLGHIAGRDHAGEAWYRVFVTGFKEQNVAAHYCDTLMLHGQGCKLAAVSRDVQDKSFLGR